ncbi:MAG: alpha-L-fucosidase [Opitutaceae bacterium]|jgi:alpha-L-fucosidase|nr:alpha-L-fucosidase [Opitutaceae bacterium]
MMGLFLDDLVPLPSPAQLAWQRTETNLFVHLCVNTFTGREWGDGSESPAIFNPAKLDCRQWARVAREAGFRIGILTAKHHDGFCLWPTATTEHSVKASPWRGGVGDVVREFVDAFRAEGLKVGLYLSPWDRHEKCYGDSPRYNDFYCAQLTELLTHYGVLHEVWFDGACAEGPNGRKQEYDWPRFFGLVKKLQPGAVTFGDGGTDVRWVGNERGFANGTCWATVDPRTVRFPGDSGINRANDAAAREELKRHFGSGDAPDPAGREPRVWRPAECDVSIRPGWFYHAEEDDKVRSAGNLVDLYFCSVGRNGLLLLNIPPTREGLFHENDIAAITGLWRELDRIFANDLARAAGVRVTADRERASGPCAVAMFLAESVCDGNPDTCWAAPEGVTKAVLEMVFPGGAAGGADGGAAGAEEEGVTVSVLCFEEPVQHGQRIAAYHVEADAGGAWTEIARGTTVGRKKLDRLATPVKARRLRLTIDEALAPPALSAWRVF